MTSREGSLDAPTRHPVAWREPEFHDEASLHKEMERVFDICHGCRRCVSLCQAFPTLFDLVDESKTMEVDGVAKSDYVKVVDQCYLCDVCYMTKCPYVPPHPWNVDFPHLMLRAKAVKFSKGETTFRDRLLTSTDRVGRLATIPVVVQMVNKANTMPLARKAMERVLGVAAQSALPPYASPTFRDSAATSIAWPVRDGKRTPGKVAIFSTCYVNFNEPGIGLDLLRVLAHNEIPYAVVEKEACCGMPKLELGDFATVEKLKNLNIPVLAEYAKNGFAIMTAVPSCTLMFKLELPLIFPEDPDVKAVAEAMVDPFEYFVLRDRDGLLKKEFPQSARQGFVSHPLPLARAERRPEDARSAGVGAGNDADHGRALRGPRRHLRREVRVLCGVDEDRPAGLPADGGGGTRLRQLRLPDCGAKDHAGHRRIRRGAPRKEGTSADAAANCLRIMRCERWPASPANHC